MRTVRLVQTRAGCSMSQALQRQEQEKRHWRMPPVGPEGAFPQMGQCLRHLGLCLVLFCPVQPLELPAKCECILE